MFYNKESLVAYFISGYIHLSKKDYGFFNNINQIIKTSKHITSNQNKLCSKLIVKYQRQFAKLGHDIHELEKLPWMCEVIETKSEYTEAHIYIENEKLFIKSPFNTSFITDIRKLSFNPFLWDKIKRCYVSSFSTVALKIAVDLTKKHFPKVNFDTKILELFDQINLYNNLHWEPTLKCTNNFYYISAINQSLYENTKHISLNSEAETLYELSQYGIKISEEILLGDPLRKFACTYIHTMDLDDLQLLANYLKILKVDTVFTSKDVIYNKQISSEIKKILFDNGIIVKPIQDQDVSHGVLLKVSTTKSRLYPEDYEYNFTKLIKLTNSRPVILR